MSTETGAKAGDSQFDELLKSLQTMNAAAAPAGVDAENPEDDDDEGEEENAAIAAAAADGKKPIMKSMTAKDEAGNEVEAFDATELLKSMQDTLTRHDDVLAKSIQPLMQAVVQQGELIKSLTSQVKKLGGQGQGRKTVLTVTELPGAGGEVAKSMGAAGQQMPSKEEFMAKATAAWQSEKLTGLELTACDVAIREGKPLPPAILKKVMA